MSTVSAEQVDAVFQSLLGRHPESEATVRHYQNLGDLGRVIDTVAGSVEAQARKKESPLWHYNSQIDALSIIKSHANPHRHAVQGRLVNFVGTIIDPAVYPPLLRGRENQIEDVPIPSNWHADIAEFAAALRAVDLAKETFRVLELGCGWGCWLLITGVAARTRGLKVDLIGAEGDAGHVAFAERGCAENGFSPDQYRILRGIVGAKPGQALFPKQEHAGESWGLEPVFDASEDEAKAAAVSGKFDVLPVLTLDSLTGDGKAIDLLHIDIQGGEAAFIESCLPALTKLVRYIVIGTHSREIEGQIMSNLRAPDWVLEIERPAIVQLTAGGGRTTMIDGVQGWRNALLQDAST